MALRSQKLSYFLVILIITGLFLISLDNGFFWDTIQLGSKHANHYYSNNFSILLLPDSIDSGHIPSFGMYICAIWKVFGRNIIATHLAMLPFIIGIFFSSISLLRKFIPEKYTGLALIIFLIDPTLLSQMTLISPDVPLVFFFLCALNCILSNRKICLSLMITLLFLTSMRGMMVSLCLLLIDISLNLTLSRSFNDSLKTLLKRSIIYFPALAIFLIYSLIHYRVKGWIGFHVNSPWAELFAGVGFLGFVRNIAILGWRLIDFGRIGVWIVLILLIVKFNRHILKSKQTRILVLISTILLTALPLNMVWAKNLLGHRYLLPVFLSISLLTIHLLFTYNLKRPLRSALFFFLLLTLSSGNLWIYPERISQGWDSTLAHLPYFKIRTQTIAFLDNEGIDFQNVQSFFPNTAKIDDIELNQDQRFFSDFDNSTEYVIYSNLFNISDSDLYKIKNEFEIMKSFRAGQLYMNVLKWRNTINGRQY